MFYNKAIFKRCFNFSKRYWYMNLKYIPLYFRLLHDLVKYGYDEYAIWETCSWFPVTMKSVLERYKDTHQGYPIVINNYPVDCCADDADSESLRQKNIEVWDGIIDHMIELLSLMDENCPKYETEEYEELDGIKKREEEREEAKNEFFKLFSMHFWNLWD